MLLFGSESWTLTLPQLKPLEGFHLRAAYKMASKNVLTRSARGKWVYPASADVLEEVGLRTIKHYVGVRRATIA